MHRFTNDLQPDRQGGDDPIFSPPLETIKASQLTAFIRFYERATGESIGSSEDLYQRSVENFQLFWQLFLLFSDLIWEGDVFPACINAGVETATFFPKLRLSYAENLLAGDS